MFDQLNVSLQNKSISLIKIILLTPNFWTVVYILRINYIL